MPPMRMYATLCRFSVFRIRSTFMQCMILVFMHYATVMAGLANLLKLRALKVSGCGSHYGTLANWLESSGNSIGGVGSERLFATRRGIVEYPAVRGTGWRKTSVGHWSGWDREVPVALGAGEECCRRRPWSMMLSERSLLLDFRRKRMQGSQPKRKDRVLV